MDNHPIPQDVTHFQFKLIGEMTLKQFAYIAAAAIGIWVTFALPLHFLIKFPLIGVFGFLGLLFAFIPVEGRPADLMITYFIKAFFTPDRYLYQKTGGNFDMAVLNKSPAMGSPIPIQTPVNKPQVPHTLSQQTTLTPKQIPKTPYLPKAAYPTPSPGPRPILITTPVYDNEPLPPIQKPEKKDEEKTPGVSQQNIPQYTSPVQPSAATSAGMQRAPQPPVQQTVSPQPVVNDALKQQLTQTLSEKQRLEQELLALKKQLEEQKAPQPSQPAAPVNPLIKKVIPPQQALRTPVMPEFPNLITGVVKDARGNVLPNILIEVKDKDGNPVRAFKTNQLGQFASATPLLNGAYTITFEDPAKQHSFDALEITATGEVLPTFEMTSVDKREELRKELFGK